MFDWINFFQQHNIHHRTSGPNVGRDGAVIHCCFCGNADESEHLVVSLSGKGFKCWRDRSHAGKNPAKLIQALLKCSWEQANAIAGQSKSLPNDFMSKVKSSLVKQEPIQVVSKLKLPPEFKKFSRLPSCQIYLNYINSRGFTTKDTLDYEIYYASQGNYKGRILFTVRQEGKLVGWTGRTIFPSAMARYKTLTNDPDKAKENGEIPAPAPISDYLLFQDRLVNTDADTIVLVEGPFDAWKVSILGSYIGVVSTCFFTSTMSKQQENLLHDLLPRFKNRFLLLDQNTFAKATKISNDLSALGIVVKRMPASVPDPGEIKTLLQLKSMLALY